MSDTGAPIRFDSMTTDTGEVSVIDILDHDQQVRSMCMHTAKSVIQGSSMLGRSSVDPRCLIAVAYFIETGLVPDELLINSVESSGTFTTEKYFTHPEGKRS